MNGLFFHGEKSPQLTFSPSFFRGVGLNHQPVIESQHWEEIMGKYGQKKTEQIYEKMMF